MFTNGCNDQSHHSVQEEEPEECAKGENPGTRITRFVRQGRVLDRHNVLCFRQCHRTSLLKRRHGRNQLLLREFAFDHQVFILRNPGIQRERRFLSPGNASLFSLELSFNGRQSLFQTTNHRGIRLHVGMCFFKLRLHLGALAF